MVRIKKSFIILSFIKDNAINIVLSHGTLHNGFWTKYSRKVKKLSIMLNIVYSGHELSKTLKNKYNIFSLMQNKRKFITVVLGSQTYIYYRYSFFGILSEAFKTQYCVPLLIVCTESNSNRWYWKGIGLVFVL